MTVRKRGQSSTEELTAWLRGQGDRGSRIADVMDSMTESIVEWRRASAKQAETERKLRDEIERLDKDLGDEITKRDEWEDRATELAEAVGEHLGRDVGEHSSANCPIRTALEYLEEADSAESQRVEIEQSQKVVDAAIAFTVEANREPGDDMDYMQAEEDLKEAVGWYIKRRETTKDTHKCERCGWEGTGTEGFGTHMCNPPPDRRPTMASNYDSVLNAGLPEKTTPPTSEELHEHRRQTREKYNPKRKANE